jgi:DUF4097 and DUF4098 domain-containing protein YvlB
MEEYKKYPLKEDGLKLYVKLVSYDLSIEECEGSDVVVEVDDLERANKALDVRFEENVLTVEQKTGVSNIRSGGDIVMRMPAGKRCSGECKSASGDIEIAGISFSGSVDTASGDIGLSSLKDRADLRLKSASGDISIREMDGKIGAHSVSGNVEVEDSSLSGLTSRTVSGDFTFSGKLLLGENAVVKTVSGDVSIDCREAENLGVSVKTMSGEIEVDGSYSSEWNEEAEKGSKLSLKTVSGEISVDIGENAKNVCVQSKSAKGLGAFKMFGTADFKEMFSHMPKGVRVGQGESREEQVSRILKMLEQEKVTAGEATELIDAL